MGLYVERVLPRIANFACGLKSVEPQRRRVCAGLEGDVVEIGFGSGLNVPFYPAGVTRIAAVEPADLAWKLADERLKASAVPVQRSGLDGQSLPFDDNSFDAALSRGQCARSPTSLPLWPSCGGCSSRAERCTSSSTGWPPTSGSATGSTASSRSRSGCHLTRPIADLLTIAGFTISEIDVFYEEGTPKSLGANSLGTAVSA